MKGGRNVMFPRGAVPADVGATVRGLRRACRWSQERLAAKVGATRRTIGRLERGLHIPSSRLVHALEWTFDLGERGLVSGWKDAASPNVPALGPRARVARRAAGLTLVDAARAAGVSPATLSRFERELGDSLLVVDEDGSGIANEGYARFLGFQDAAEMSRFCLSRNRDPDEHGVPSELDVG